MTNEELKQLIESNDKTAQAMLDAMVEVWIPRLNSPTLQLSSDWYLRDR